MNTGNDPLEIAKRLALRRLSRKECSSSQIRSFLIQKGTSPDIAHQVVSDLLESGLINDEKFTRIWVRHQTLQGKGPRVIRQKLKKQGVDLSITEVDRLARETTHHTSEEMARKLVERRYPMAKADPAEAAKAIRGLVRRGFTYSIAYEVIFGQAPSEEDETEP